jgi:hypothetical protein
MVLLFNGHAASAWSLLHIGRFYIEGVNLAVTSGKPLRAPFAAEDFDPEGRRMDPCGAMGGA